MKKIYFIWKMFVFLFITCLLVLLGFYLYAYITPKMDIHNSNRIVMLDKDDNVFYENSATTSWVSLEDISEYAIWGIVATEDKNFYNHNGFDYLRILKALYSDFKNGELNQGASTISQQYIKNLFLSFDKTWERKLEEAYLTFELEVHYTKDEILEGYLNTINYGAGNYGIEDASFYYFNKHAKDLTLAEASIIVGIPKNPTYYNPIYYLENAKSRQKIVLQSMVSNGYITESEMEEAYNQELVFHGVKVNNHIVSSLYYKDAVISELNSISEIPKSLIETGGLKIYTNLDNKAQEKLENIVSEEMANTGELQVGAVIREPKTGNIVALIGGKNYNESQFNRVTQAKRQVGSTFKPILYYAALENGMTPTSTFVSEATTFSIGNDEVYSPTNYANKYANKEITMADALALSDNIFAVKTHLFLGTNVLKKMGNRMGIKTPLPNNPSLALGTTELGMIDFSNAFATLANEGIKNEPRLIRKVTDLDDNVIYEYSYEEESVLDKRYTFILNEMLSNTYNYDYIDYASPTLLTVSGLLTKKYAAKSGTTSSDYWVVGYNPDALVMVWNGFDDNRDVDVVSSKITKRIWARTIEAFLEDKEETWYSIPKGVTATIVNPINGSTTDLSIKDALYYIRGTEPEYVIGSNNPYIQKTP